MLEFEIGATLPGFRDKSRGYSQERAKHGRLCLAKGSYNQVTQENSKELCMRVTRCLWHGGRSLQGVKCRTRRWHRPGDKNVTAH
eukprot:3651994-Pyramimonas_sp.AAC.1